MKQIESFFWGIIAALGALVLEFIFFFGYSIYANPSGTFSFSQFFLIPSFIIAAAFIEETFKYIVISKRIEMLSLEKSYLVNSFLVGLGFFGVELGAIFLSGPLPATQFLVEIAIIHMGTAGLMGYFVAIGNPKKISTFIFATIVAVFFHAGYNLLTLRRDFIQNYAIFALLGLLFFINFVNFLRISRKLAQQ
jgi:hypothetical protein